MGEVPLYAREISRTRLEGSSRVPGFRFPDPHSNFRGSYLRDGITLILEDTSICVRNLRKVDSFVEGLTFPSCRYVC